MKTLARWARQFGLARAVCPCRRFGLLRLRVFDPPPLQELRLRTFDLFQVLRPREQTFRPVAIVDIDEASLKEIGQWPWPRTIMARLVDKLHQAGAAAIAFDVLFSEPDRTSPKMLMSLLTDRGAGEEDAKRLVASMQDPDAEFAKAIAEAPVVLGFDLTGTGIGG